MAMEKLSPYKDPILKTLVAVMSWTNALMPKEQQLDDKMIQAAYDIIERVIPNPVVVK